MGECEEELRSARSAASDWYEPASLWRTFSTCRFRIRRTLVPTGEPCVLSSSVRPAECVAKCVRHARQATSGRNLNLPSLARL